MGNKHNKRSRHAKATWRELREEAAQRREAEMEATEEQEQLRLQRAAQQREYRRTWRARVQTVETGPDGETAPGEGSVEPDSGEQPA
ncbi:hypothetical protein KC19_8G026500, partial [Ceratodon purpureus]